MTVKFRRNPTQTASLHSASLPVHEMMFCSLLMTLSSATSHWDFPYNVVGSKADRISVMNEHHTKREGCQWCTPIQKSA